MGPGRPERAPEARGSRQGERSAADPGGSWAPPPPLGYPSGAFSARGPLQGAPRKCNGSRAEHTPLAQCLYLMSAPNEGALLHFLNQPSPPCELPRPGEPHDSTGAPRLPHQPERTHG
ncbi:hypothetical protein NDU88_004448 [Pleurodeles waltl]|uniref:Uncharacterized protein n=1 Tax=Pleurodeles waltl TaxID=8319 RepID=A0AAV7RLD8_PLEWA|nr:hypothetical protein NDU88_004448 [Pleurodeles waltl]